MILIIMRHGEAQEYREPDFSRALTDVGKRQCEQVGVWLNGYLDSLNIAVASEGQNNNDKLNRIQMTLVSPYLRTQQSLRAVAKGIELDQQVVIDSVTPMGIAAECADLIHAYANDSNAPQTLLVVSHMPLVSLLADKICPQFEAQYFEPANALAIDYNVKTGFGKQLIFYKGK